MNSSEREMVLGVFFQYTGHHVASWLHPQSQIDAGVNFRHFVELAKAAEAAKFHFLFFADWVGVRDADMDALSRSAQYTAHFEPLTLLGGLAAVTEKIGLVCTASTSYNEPYHVARKFASLDHMSEGRAAWNIVTSAMKSEALNFGREEHFSHDERYERAREFVDVVKGLWDSWDDDAFVRDRDTGRYFDPERMHYLNHEGKHFKVRGPLNCPRPPQGHPVFVQAGSSDDGRDFAASIAEIVFVAPPDLQAAQAFYKDIKARMAKFGREPDQMKVTPGINPIVGETEDEAQEKYDELQNLIDPIVGREILSTVLGFVDLKGHDVDGPLPELPESLVSAQGTRKMMIELARREKLTIRDLYMRVAGARGKLTIKGSAKTIADQLEQWFVEGGCDGFIVLPAVLPGTMNDFIRLVVPELRRRGLFQSEYQGNSLREYLGLKRPESRYNAG